MINKNKIFYKIFNLLKSYLPLLSIKSFTSLGIYYDYFPISLLYEKDITTFKLDFKEIINNIAFLFTYKSILTIEEEKFIIKFILYIDINNLQKLKNKLTNKEFIDAFFILKELKLNTDINTLILNELRSAIYKYK